MKFKRTCYLLFYIVTAIFSGCDYFYRHITISGLITELNSGDVIIKDQSGEVVFGVPIKNGKFYIPKQELPYTGYYKLYIASNKNPFEIYLEPGDYTIKTSLPKIVDYPLIITSSKTQSELNDYHAIADKLIIKTDEKLRLLTDSMNVVMLPEKYNRVVNNFKLAQTAKKDASFNALNSYLAQYPDSKVITHLLANINYENEPVKFYNLYQKFSAKAKNTDEGIVIGNRLSALVKLMPGMTPPLLQGKTPDSKTINFKSLNKKLIIVEFWRASLSVSRKNHRDFINNLLPNFADKGVGIVSVSLDTKENWWRQAIKDDNMNWPQVSDLKGFDSPNVSNWAVNVIPMYCILDGSGRMIQRDVQYLEIPVTINSYLDARN